ncbi:Type II secretion system protein E [Prochlorococcus marinus str. MIT 1318]|uniref:GspE/PulE family protein n=1 Tax=Prochlorococcus TaxID=1218 RepID=UPI0007B38A83|nr:GspE/PulE family protein [Prochlorococcus marinus]KZR71022.1 Type II secretion system protein E [Prochlorococcus marinus str. MIT 1318]
MNQTKERRKLIDKHFSLAWCRENIVIPLGVETAAFPNKQRLTVAVGNFSYLATIGESIKKRAADANLECVFIEKPADQIQALLDEAATERLISGEGLENYDYSDDAILEALKAAEDDQNPVGFDFDFDDNAEAELIDEALDLSAEMLGSKIQQAAANILIHSTRSNVSDIHVEPRLEEYKIRVRRDGVMQDFVRMPRAAGIKLTACLKNMAQMDIAERRASQDGKIFRRFEGQKLEFRCSTAPGKHGEKMVLRILNSDEGMLSLDVLITNEEIKKNFRRIIEEANGIVIVSGPTGSGKSTTLASALREKDTGELNIVTAEDPIEYDLGGNIQQFPVMRAKGQTFANLLRTFLRQDPDVILIGETRDPETAESSMDAAETGHLVFTTLHANSASTSLTRLLDMEVPSYKLTASLRGVLAQRLLRKVCPECSSKRPIDDLESRFTGLRRGTEVRVATALKAEEKEQRKREGTLCTRCSGTGYKGRIGTYELMTVNRRISDAIKQKKSTREIEDIAVEDGMLTLKAYAVDLIKNQLTTVSELQKICNTEY